jgi:hypothetical protein
VVLEDGGFVGDFDEEGEAELGAAAAGVDGALFDGEGEEVFVADVEQGQDTAAQVGVGVIDGEEVLGDLEHRAGGVFFWTGFTGFWGD